MQGYFAAATVILLVILVLSRVYLMNKMGIKAFKFGEMDKKDFLIPPFALLFFYLIFASTLNLPKPGVELFSNEIARWIGVALCMLGLILFLLSLISFGKSFRVGIDEEHPNWILLLYLVAGIWLFNRQVLREEDSLKKIYGEEYVEYCKKVHKYL